jgi:hypothetical protein
VERKCSGCKHWGAEDLLYLFDELPDDGDRAGCRARREGWKLCGFIPHCYDEDDEEALALVQDGSGYAGGLFVHPDFGCIHWREKP